MASPQKENGFTPIANEILEALVNTHLLGAEFEIVLFIIRKTYGYKKINDRISLSQFTKATGLSKPTIIKSLKNLQLKNILIRKETLKGYSVWSFNKNYDNWVVNAPLLVNTPLLTSKHAFTKTSKHAFTYKRKKENIQKRVDIKKYKPEFIK